MIFNSIRWRLQVWHGLILVAVLMGFGFTAYQVARDNQLRRIDQDLEQQLAIVSRPPPQREPPPEHSPGDRPPPEDRRWNRPGPRGDPAYFIQRMQEYLQQVAVSEIGQSNSFYFVMWRPDRSVAVRSSGAPADVPVPERTSSVRSESVRDSDARGGPPPPDPGSPMFSAARTRGELREVFRFMPFDDCILVGRSIAPDLAAMHRLALWLVAAGAGVLVLGLAGGSWLAARAIRPIQDISATAVKIAGGDLSQRINAADTDSELGRLAGVLNSTFARLEAAFTHQARFTADASHELRTPVSVILSQTQTALSRDRAGTEYREALEACQRAAQRMRKLTESLLELARLDAGQEPMKRETFDLSRVARECVELVRPLAAERGIEIGCDLPALQALGDAERIAQVVTNLLTNAIHFNHERGEVHISVRAEYDTAVLTVTDTGKGIPAEDLPHIFERFYRVDRARAGIQGRTGLGLAICKAIMDTHGGAIEVSSQPGVGSTFTVKLPLK